MSAVCPTQLFITHKVRAKVIIMWWLLKNTIHRFIGFLSRKSHLRCRAWTRYIPGAKCQRGLYESHRQLIKHCSSALGQSLKFASLPHFPDDSQSPLRFTWQLIRGDSYSATICPLLFYTKNKEFLYVLQQPQRGRSDTFVVSSFWIFFSFCFSSRVTTTNFWHRHAVVL